MSETTKNENPLVATIVKAGEKAEAINDFIFMVKDVSNAYLITTSDGDVLINTGFPPGAERNHGQLAPHRSGPLRTIVLTQSHPDHYGGIDVFLEDGTKVIVQANFLNNMKDWATLAPFYTPRALKLWGTLDEGAPKPKYPDVKPDFIVDRDYDFEVGGRRFELIWTPDGETTDSLTVWLPKEKIVFTGNLFGPVFLSMPFLSTMRGDKPRLVRDYLTSLTRVRDLNAEILITGHGEPIRGAERIRADLDRLHAAVTWVRDYTFEGMCAGKDVHTLMREVRLPQDLAIGEYHGKVAWSVRSIWEQYAGWFHYDSTTSLYGVPRSSVDADIVELSGGGDALAGRALLKLNDDCPLEALHLVDIALGGDPGNLAALKVKEAALETLLAISGGENLSETMWLRAEITDTQRHRKSA